MLLIVWGQTLHPVISSAPFCVLGKLWETDQLQQTGLSLLFDSCLVTLQYAKCIGAFSLMSSVHMAISLKPITIGTN